MFFVRLPCIPQKQCVRKVFAIEILTFAFILSLCPLAFCCMLMQGNLQSWGKPQETLPVKLLTAKAKLQKKEECFNDILLFLDGVKTSAHCRIFEMINIGHCVPL